VADEALALALQALARKERSVAEMGVWLRGRGVENAEVEEVLGHLLASGALDDARFAVRFAEDKRELASWGGERIRAALAERRVPDADIEAALAADHGELERAEALVRNRGIDLDDDRGRGRALALLLRRGYDSDVAYEAVRRAGDAD
jgi:SOS response regulatory protein OraA/RecX